MANLKKEISIAIAIIKSNLAATVELRSTFILQTIGMALNDTSLVVLWIFFFQAFGRINGWSSVEYLAMLGLNAAAYGLTFSFLNGSNTLARLVDNGSFDSLLLSPRNLYLRILTSSMSISSMGDLLFGSVILILFLIFSGFSFLHFILIVSLIIPSALIIANFCLIAQMVSFFIPDAQSISKNIFEIFLSPSLYPAGLFQGVLRIIFIVIIPSLVIGGLPVEAAIYLNWKLYVFIWLASLFWTLLAIKLLDFAVRKYESGNLTGARI